MLRRLRSGFLLIGCLVSLVGCEMAAPTPPPAPSISPRVSVQPTPEATLTWPAIKSQAPQATLTPLPASTPLATALPPTIPAPRLTTLAQIATAPRVRAVPPASLQALTFTITSVQPVWTVWHTAPSPDAVLAVAAQADRVWVGTHFGIWRVEPLVHHIEKYPAPIDPISLLLPIEDGQVWAGSTANLYFFDGQHWRTIHSSRVSPIDSYSAYNRFYSFALGVAGDLWVGVSGYRGGLTSEHYRGHVPVGDVLQANPYDGSSPDMTPFNCQRLAAVASLHDQSFYSSADCAAFQAAFQVVPLPARGMRLAFDADDSLWGVNLDNGEVNHWSAGQLLVFKLPADARINALAADPAHGVWIGTDRGLIYTDGQVIYQLPGLDRHFTGGSPIDLAVESSGDVWVLTAESTLSWLPADRSTGDFKLAGGVSARAIAAAADGVWITHGTDLIRLKLGDRMPASITAPEADCRLDRLTAAPNGDVWATSRCGFAWQYQPAMGQWTRHVLDASTSAVAKFEPVAALVAASDGVVYAIGLSGFAPLTERGSAIAGTPELPDDTRPYSTYRHRVQLLADGVAPLSNGPGAADRHGGFWLTTTNRGNLWHYANGQFTALEHPFSSTWITTLHVDQANRLWAANLYGQLAMYDGQQWRMFPTPGIGTVYRVADAPNGQLWLVGSQGVALYDPAQDTQP